MEPSDDEQDVIRLRRLTRASAFILIWSACSQPHPQPDREPASKQDARLLLSPLRFEEGHEFKPLAPRDLVKVKETKECKKVPQNLRRLFYEQFLAQTEGKSAGEARQEARSWSQRLAKAMKRSDGNPNAMSDRNEHGPYLSESRFVRDNLLRDDDTIQKSSLESRAIQHRSIQIRFDDKTGFGFFLLPAAVSGARATRALFRAAYLWRENNPEELVKRCGTPWMFEDSTKDLLNAFQDLSTCSVGSSNSEEAICFGKWITLCPHLSLSIEKATSTPPQNAPQTCKEAFLSLIKR